MTRAANDFYPTPHSFVAALVRAYQPDTPTIWEPCQGDGRIADAYRTMGYGVFANDIATGSNFFDIATAPSPALVTNPPFRGIRDFIGYAFSIGVETMALVCPERLWACGKGGVQWSRNRPSRWLNMTWREDYLGKGGAPDRALAIGIWDRPHSESCSYEIIARAK